MVIDYYIGFILAVFLLTYLIYFLINISSM